MKEIVFLNKNAREWKQMEQNIASGIIHNPDELTEMYARLTDDLSYAKTYYPDSETEHYLNNLVRKLHAYIYRTKKEKNNRFLVFWKYEFPYEIYKARKFIIWSAAVFLFAAFIGALSAAGEQDFVRLILGDAYVDMTIRNIDNGEPMAVYASADSDYMFPAIAYNNVRVAMLTFILGMFSYFGTGAVLFFNGIMLGSFQYFFHKYNLLYESALSIWIHGTIEIFAVMVAGGAGLILGSSFLFPRTYSRKVSFMKGAKRGAKMILGLIPFIIFAAFLEGYVTRLTHWPDALRIGIIGASIAGIVFYFMVYPYKLNKKMQQEPEFREFYNNLF